MSKIKECFTSRFDGGKMMEADFCLHPDTKLLTHDFKYVPAKEVRVGDELVGFEEELRKYNQTQFKKATVTGVKAVIKPCLRVWFDDGTFVIGSKDHSWVACDTSRNPTLRWMRMDELDIGDYIPQVCEVWEDKSNTTDGSWLGGFLDGEGWISHASTFGVGQNIDDRHQCVWDKMLPILRATFDSLSYSPSNSSKVVRVSPNGLRTAWTAVGTFRPTRLLKTLQETYEGTILRSKRNRKKFITKIEDVGDWQVMAIETNTHTFIAEGMPSHNCQLEVVGLAILSKDKQLKEDLLNGIDFHAQTACWLFNKDYDEFMAKLKAGDKKTKEERQAAKEPNFLNQYGGGAGLMSKRTGIPLSRCKNFINKYYERYWEVRRYQDSLMSEVLENAKPSKRRSEKGFPIMTGYYTAPTGRRHVFYEYDGKRPGETAFSPTQMKNFQVQGFATGDIVPEALGKLFRGIKEAGLDDKVLMVGTVHDSVVFDVHPNFLTWTEEYVKITMEGVHKEMWDRYKIDIDLPLNVDVSVADNWGDCK